MPILYWIHIYISKYIHHINYTLNSNIYIKNINIILYYIIYSSLKFN